MKFIKVKTQFESFHCWPEAPDEVKFLRDLHRHIFHVTATFSVDKNDRELEFFMVQRVMNEYIESFIKDMPERSSCEDMAEEIARYLTETYKGRYIEVEVSEDGENSSIVNNA